MKSVVALALALTAQAIEIDWRVPGDEPLPPVTVDPATDATITFKWNGFHNVYEMPSEAAMNSCDFSGAQEVAPSSSGSSVTVDALSGDGPFTVFAPTDDAFAALPAGTVESLLLPENLTTLQDILKYHVVPAKVLSTDLTLNQHATTLEGSDVTVTSLDPVKINESEVIQADVMASNGVIHVISAVLMPPSDDEPTMGPTAMEESDSAGRASLAVAAAAAVAYVL